MTLGEWAAAAAVVTGMPFLGIALRYLYGKFDAFLDKYAAKYDELVANERTKPPTRKNPTRTTINPIGTHPR